MDIEAWNENWTAAFWKNGAPVLSAMLVVHACQFGLFEFIGLLVTCFMSVCIHCLTMKFGIAW